jgi:D-aminopeptidase
VTAHQLSRRRFLGYGLGTVALSGVTSSCIGAVASTSGPTISGSGADPIRQRQRQRLRDLGIIIGELPPGPHNAITDVAGVLVGHATRIIGTGPLVIGQGPVRSGVTAILPRGADGWRNPVYAADWILNGNGELTGTGPIRRTGQLAAPILLTDTGSVGSVYDGALDWMLKRDPACLETHPVAVPVVGETWANTLHDTAGRHIGAAEVAEAIGAASTGPVAEGSVGGGTGMRAFRFKAGIGTASRRVPMEGDSTHYTVGVLVQANFGGRSQLRVDGVPVGESIADLTPEYNLTPTIPPEGNSLLVVMATDAPLLPIQLQRLCKRAALGLARTGSIATHGSGDLLVAFSTAPVATAGQPARALHFGAMSRIYAGIVESTEEAILNSLTMAETMTGRDGNTIHALPLDRLVKIMHQHGRL